MPKLSVGQTRLNGEKKEMGLKHDGEGDGYENVT